MKQKFDPGTRKTCVFVMLQVFNNKWSNVILFSYYSWSCTSIFSIVKKRDIYRWCNYEESIRSLKSLVWAKASFLFLVLLSHTYTICIQANLLFPIHSHSIHSFLSSAPWLQATAGRKMPFTASSTTKFHSFIGK